MSAEPFRYRGHVFRDADDCYDYYRQQALDDATRRGRLWRLLLAARQALRRRDWQQAARHLNVYHYQKGRL